MTPYASLSRFPRQQCPRHIAVVERQHLAADDLVGLVPFAGDDDRVARARPRERRADRSVAIGHAGVALAPYVRRAGGDLGDNRLGILGTRVVRGDPRVIREARGNLAHDRALRSIAVTAATE